MQYNLARNGSLEALTISGTGNKSLLWAELESLMDGTTSSGGVSLTSGDVLWLEADMSNRIKLDSVRLYASDLTKLANIEFYYKDNEGDSYTICSKNVSTFYYPTLPDPKAPRFVLTTISGVDIQLHEYMLVNDDYIVAFGTDGSLYAKYLDNCPIGETGFPEAVPIFNNSTNPIPADAYVCIDYTDSGADSYIKISSSINGTYYGIEDGAILEDDKESSIYRWSMGEHNNTTVSGDDVVLVDPTISGGVYTSPIFRLDNKYMTSYFITNGITKSGTSSISYNENVYNGTIRVRNSDTKPLDVDEVYWLYKSGSNQIIEKTVIYNGNVIANWVFWNQVSYDPLGTATNKRTGDVAMCTENDSGFSSDMRIYNRSGGFLYSYGGGAGNYYCRFNVNFEFDKFGGVWGYGDYGKYLVHWNNALDTRLYELNDGTDFLYDLAVEMDGDGVWYTNKIDNIVIHKDYEGTTLNTIVLNEPKAICGTLDNGCWVIDNTDKKAYKYNSGATLIKTVNLERTATRMCTDMVDGFWYISGNYVYHVTSNGVEDINVNITQLTKIKGGYNGCIVWSSNNDWVKYIDNNGNITRTFTDPSGVGKTGIPALFSFRYSDFKTFKDIMNVIPASYDPVYGVGGSLEWKEVKKDGYFLPKTAYHQAEITLRCQGVTSPSLNKLIISPAVKIQDISKQSSKNVYVKTVIPDGAGITDYETRLKAWWGVSA
jgi:hypothetical protein